MGACLRLLPALVSRLQPALHAGSRTNLKLQLSCEWHQTQLLRTDKKQRVTRCEYQQSCEIKHVVLIVVITTFLQYSPQQRQP